MFVSVDSCQLLIEKPKENVCGHPCHACAFFRDAGVMQVYSGARNRKVDGLMMWITERDGEKWGVIESTEMVIPEVLRRSAYYTAADLRSPQLHAAPPESER